MELEKDNKTEDLSKKGNKETFRHYFKNILSDILNSKEKFEYHHNKIDEVREI